MRPAIDDRRFRALRAKLERELSDTVVKVGVFGSGEGEMVDVAATHEFGSRPGKFPKVPERSFLRRTFINERERFAKAIAGAAKRIGDGRITAAAAFNALGQMAEAAVKNTIASGPHIPPPLAPATVARRTKKSKRPLSDKGQLKGSITYRVGKRDKGGIGLWR